jgi:hypothetical protein
MPDILDTLEWKPWPKDPGWVYADISGVARIGRKTGGVSHRTSYFVRALDEDGELGTWRYINIERNEAARIVCDVIKALSLQATS